MQYLHAKIPEVLKCPELEGGFIMNSTHQLPDVAIQSIQSGSSVSSVTNWFAGFNAQDMSVSVSINNCSIPMVSLPP